MHCDSFDMPVTLPGPVSLSFIALFAIAAVRVSLSLLRARRTRKLMPPGPPGIPLLGNALQVSKEQAFRQFAKWAKTYGPVFSLNLAGKPVVVVNSLKTANDLFDRRSAIYSDRPRLIVANEIYVGEKSIAFMPYGQSWRKQRRAIHEAMNIREQVDAYTTIQQREATNLVLSLLNDPNHWRQHCSRTTASSVVSIVYGTALASRSLDMIVERIWDLVHTTSRLAGKTDAYLVDIFPFLLYMPSWLAKWKREGEAFFRRYCTLFEGYLGEVRVQMNEGKSDSSSSLCGHLIKEEDKHGLSSLDVAWLAGVMISAGTDTTAGMLSVFVLVMLWHPDIMHRAQAELDAVVGRERLPTFEDQEALPYINAIVKEMLRWWPVAHLGLPRSCIEDDWYNGHFIPKGTMIIQNVWAMGRNSEDFPDPESFQPERFLDDGDKARISREAKAQKPIAFGFGRRLCPGMSVAMGTLFIDVACMLWALDFRPDKDDRGEPVLPGKTECSDDGLIVEPVSFSCSITSRFSGVRGIVEMAKSRDSDLSL